MSQSMDVRNLLPKSLDVSRIEQLRSAAEHQQQQQLAVKQQKEQNDRLHQVTQMDKSEGQRIQSEDDANRKKHGQQQRKKPNNEEKDTVEEKMHLDDGRGHFIDFRV